MLTQCGETALIAAAEWGRTDCVRLLLESGADKNARNNVRDTTCRFDSRNRTYSFIFQCLCFSSAPYIHAQEECTALIRAAHKCQLVSLRLLVEAGADKDAVDNVRPHMRISLVWGRFARITIPCVLIFAASTR